MRIADVASAFPDHYYRPEIMSRVMGAMTVTRRLTSVQRDNIVLIGEASGSVDAITGEGLSLAFQQAAELPQAMRAGSSSVIRDHTAASAAFLG